MKHLLCLLLFISFGTSAQYDVSKNISTYTLQDGFNIYGTASAVFDDLGWLWISGSNLQLLDTDINRRTAIIQRFDGSRFQTLSTPKHLGKKPIDIVLVKRTDGCFYAILSYANEDKLFVINPNTLHFKEVKLPTNKQNLEIFLFPYKDAILGYFRDAKETHLYKITNELELIKLKKPIVNKDKNKYPHFSNFIPFDDFYMISDVRSGVRLYNKNGSLLKTVSNKDLGLTDKKLDYFLGIDTWFKEDDLTYISFRELQEYYQYNPKKNSWTKTTLLKKANNNITFNGKTNTDLNGNILKQYIVNSQLKLEIHYNKSNTKKVIHSELKKEAKVVSRNLEEELYVINEGFFYQYTFKRNNVKTFLEGKSIRAMHQLNNNEILVATESNGWYLLNLETQLVKPFPLSYNGQLFIPNSTRGIFEDETYLWGNNNKGIFSIHKKTKEVETYVYYPIATSTADENSIFYGTHKNNLIQFDKKTKENIILKNTKNYDIQGILKVDERIYLTCAEGLLIYENDQTELHTLNDEKPNNNFFIAIAFHKKYGLLVGNSSGELYQFNTTKKTFQLLYKDLLKASIATILFDDDFIWMNTYNGIVAYNSSTKKATRYTMNDGLSFYEANRYSALKTTEGSFLVGTLQGLNYFNPKTISKKKLDVSLKLSQVSYFNKKLKKDISEKIPEKLNALKNITLSPENKSLNLQFALFGMYDFSKINYRYRLDKRTWINLANKTEIRLLNLAAGNYNLEIEAINLANKRVGLPIFLTLTVDEFFYKTIWFYLLLLLMLIIIGIWYYAEQQKKYQLKTQFAQDLIKEQENERKRLSRDLHDGIAQDLMLLKNQLEFKEDSINQKLAENTLTNLRNVSLGLHPFVLEKFGLTEAINQLVNQLDDSQKIFFDAHLENIDGYFSKNQQLHIYRIVQEAINNALKYADSPSIKITLQKKNTAIFVEIKDFGKGFTVSEKANKIDSLGLKTMQERSKMIPAKLTILSEKEQGTTVQLKYSNV